METLHSKIQTLRFLLPVLWKISGAALMILISTTLVQGLVPIMQLSLTSKLVGTASQLFQEDSASHLLKDVWRLVGLQFMLLLTNAFLGSVFKYTNQFFNERATLYFDEMMSNKVNRLPLSYFDNHLNYDRLQRTSFSIQMQGISIVFIVLSMIQSSITLVGFIIVLYQFHWLLSLGMLLLVIPMLWTYLYESKASFNLFVQQTPDERMASSLSHLLKSREGAKEIRVFELAEYLISKWRLIAKRNVERKLTLERKTIRISFFAQMLSLVMLSGMLLFALNTGANGALEIGQYAALAQALFSTQTLVQGLAQGYSSIHQSLLHVGEVLDFVNLTDESEQSKDSVEFPSPMKQGIHLENLTFQYEGASKSSIEAISFSIKAGETIAIVGDNGAGKSTLAKCLLGLYSPSSGSITVDGLGYEEIQAESLRSHMSAIFQDFVQYPFPVWENIGLGEVAELENRDRLKHSAVQANTTSFINKLPDGWNTVLGIQFDGGHELSYGQWQRIALNRAFFRDFDVIVLDEPTASLDPMTEAAIFENLMTLTRDKTSIFITHRLGSCRYADRILVLKEGRLVETGDHETLMDRDGEYAAMFRKQAGWYTKEWDKQELSG